MNLISHNASTSVWSEIRRGLETNQIVYASTSTGEARVLIVENCLEFVLAGQREKEKVIVLHDVKNKAKSPLAFQWSGRWSK